MTEAERNGWAQLIHLQWAVNAHARFESELSWYYLFLWVEAGGKGFGVARHVD